MTTEIEKMIEAEVKKRISEQKPFVPSDGAEFCIVRCRDAGVHAGYVDSKTDHTVILLNSRRLWRYYTTGLGTCSELAIDGLVAGSESRISPALTRNTLAGWCEITVATGKAKKSIENWKNE